MIESSIGEIIKRMRITYGISQSRLCNGLCSVSMLSKIESGERYPSRLLYDALIERGGGIEAEQNCVVVAEDMEISKARDAITRATEENKKSEFEQSIQKLREMISNHDTINQQFILEMESRWSTTVEEKRTKLFQAISTTCPGFQIENFSDYLLCKNELMIINNIVCSYIEDNELLYAYRLFQKLLNYIKVHTKFDAKADTIYPVILSNYIHCSYLMEKYDEIIQCIDSGIDACIKNKIYRLLPNLYFHKCATYSKLGRVNEVKETALYAYYLCNMLGEVSLAKHLKDELEKRMGVSFEVSVTSTY